jgi:hypothetical protein
MQDQCQATSREKPNEINELAMAWILLGVDISSGLC